MTSAIVLAAGKGTRMVSEKAKTMHMVMGKPMLEHIYDTLKHISCDDIVFVVGHGHQQIEDYFKDKVSYALQQPQLGSGHAVMQAEMLKGKKGKTLIINGDCPLITADTYTEMLEKAEEYPLVLLTVCLDDPASYGRIVRNEKGEVTRIVERKDCTPEEVKINEINAGIYCVDNQLLWQMLPKITNDNAQHEYYVTDLVGLFIKYGYSVGVVTGSDFRELQGINNRRELAMASQWLQEHINKDLMTSGVSILDPANTYISADTVIGEDTIIYPGVRIEGHCRIGKGNIITEGCVLDNAIIGSNNKLEKAVVRNATIGSNCNIGPWVYIHDDYTVEDNSDIGSFVELKK